MFVKFIMFVAVVLLLTAIVTEIVAPILYGTPLFPFFWSKNEAKLRSALADANQKRVEKELADKLAITLGVDSKGAK